MKRLVLLILFAGFALPAAAQTWTYTGTLPSDTLRRGTTGAYVADVHGLAVDESGNVWIQSHRPIENITLTEDLQINSAVVDER